MTPMELLKTLYDIPVDTSLSDEQIVAFIYKIHCENSIKAQLFDLYIQKNITVNNEEET